MHSPQSPELPMPVAIIGAAGGWGSKFVQAADSLKMKTLKVDPALQHREQTEETEAIRQADAIIFAVSGRNANNILQSYEPGSLSGKIILDIATVKSDVAHALNRHADAGACVCSTHPLVMPHRDVSDHTALIMPVGGQPSTAVDLANKLYSHMGMRPVDFKFEQHDMVVLPLQTIDHALQRIRLELLRDLMQKTGINLQTLEEIGSANFLLNQVVSGRMTKQKPDISAEIIASPVGQSMLHSIETVIKDFQGKDAAVLATGFGNTADEIDPSYEWKTRMTNLAELLIRRALDDRQDRKKYIK